jgi:purine-binding chemotaxis protein CheW
MSTIQMPANNRAAALQAAFDRSFAVAPDANVVTNDGLLAIRVGATPYLVRLTEVSGLFADKKVTALPSPVRELLGIAGLRGTVLPVYDLGMMLGFPKAAAPRWLLVAAAAPVGLAFDGFDGYVSAPREAVARQAHAETRQRYVREILQIGIPLPVIHVPSVLETITNRGGDDRKS